MEWNRNSDDQTPIFSDAYFDEIFKKIKNENNLDIEIDDYLVTSKKDEGFDIFGSKNLNCDSIKHILIVY